MTRRKANTEVQERPGSAPGVEHTALGEGPPEPAGLVDGTGNDDPFDFLDEAVNDELNDLLVGLAHSRRTHPARHRVLD